MKQLFILENGAKGGNGDAEERLRNLGGAGGFEIFEVASPAEAAERTKREAIRGGELRICACGGDALLSACVHAAAGFRNAAVTQWPLRGSADFLATFGDDARRFSDPAALVRGFVRPVDVIDVSGRKCIGACTVGADARIAADSAKCASLPLLGEKSGRRLSKAVNLLRGTDGEFTLRDPQHELNGRCTVVCAFNGRVCGAGGRMESAEPDDGRLDFAVLSAPPRLRAAQVLEAYHRGEYGRFPEYLARVRARRLTVEADDPFPVCIDGWVARMRTADIRVVPGGVNFIFPEGMEYFDMRDKKNEAETSKISR